MKSNITALIASLPNMIQAADHLISPYVRETPLEFSAALSEITSAEIYVKMENLQTTGSFKLRGAANMLLQLPQEQRARGVVTASSGNHAAACAYMFSRLGIDGTIYLPETVSPLKLQALAQYNVHIEKNGNDCVVAEKRAREVAVETGKTLIPPYNHPDIIAGQGTIGLELEDQIDSLDTVLVPVGGGGLISGIGSYLTSINPAIEIYGCQPENSAVMADSIKAGKILDFPSKPTLADGTAGGIEPDSITFDICQNVVNGFFRVSESAIKQAAQLIIEKHHILVEGAAVLSVAAIIQQKARFHGKKVALVLSGGRVSLAALKEILDQ